MNYATQEMYDEIERTGLFDFISTHGYKFSQSELYEMFREFNYAVYSIDREVEKEAVKLMIEEIKFRNEE